MYFGELGLKANIDGEKEIMIPSSDSVSYKYNADVTDCADGKKLFSEQPQTSWSLGGAYSGVTIDDNGNLTVTNNATLGTVKIVCESHAIVTDVPSSQYRAEYGIDTHTIELTNIETYEVNIIPIAPVLQDLAVSASKNSDDAEVAPSYTYIQGENVKESGTLYKWYKSDSENGDYTEISTDEKITISPNQYIYIKLEVTPKDENGNVGKSYTTNPILCSALFGDAPEITNVEIKSYDKVAVGSKVYANYLEKDNKDILIDTQWYRSSDNTLYEKSSFSKDYTFTKDDVNIYLKAQVTPYYKDGDAKIMGKAVMTKYIDGVATPKIENLLIGGNPTIGNTLYADYLYTNSNGIGEGKSIYEWSIGGNVVCNEASYKIPNNVANIIIVLAVTPVSADDINGEKTSTSKTITTVVSNKEVGGSSGGSAIRSDKPVAIAKPSEDTKNEDDSIVNFEDTKNHWAKSSIDKLFEKNIITGNQDKMFEPDKNVTRAEAVTMVIKSLGIPFSKYEDDTFSDVKKDEWYSDCLMTAYECGIINGDTDKKANPNANIKREELAAIIVRTVEFKTQNSVATGNDISFTDIESISSWFREDVRKAFNLGLINGMEDGSFAPLSNATKAQCATITERLLEKIK